jgi:hypothetical protein
MPDQDPDEQLAAARAEAARLREELEQLREDMGRELMRRSFAEADREWARGGTGSPAMLVAAEYEATTSWKLTRPLRAMGRLLRREG